MYGDECRGGTKGSPCPAFRASRDGAGHTGAGERLPYARVAGLSSFAKHQKSLHDEHERRYWALSRFIFTSQIRS